MQGMTSAAILVEVKYEFSILQKNNETYVWKKKIKEMHVYFDLVQGKELSMIFKLSGHSFSKVFTSFNTLKKKKDWFYKLFRRQEEQEANSEKKYIYIREGKSDHP